MSASIQAANLSDPGQARLVIVGGLSGALAAEGRTAVHHAKTGGVKRALYRLARGGVASSDFHRRFADPVPSNSFGPLARWSFPRVQFCQEPARGLSNRLCGSSRSVVVHGNNHGAASVERIRFPFGGFRNVEC